MKFLENKGLRRNGSAEGSSEATRLAGRVTAAIDELTKSVREINTAQPELAKALIGAQCLLATVAKELIALRPAPDDRQWAFTVERNKYSQIVRVIAKKE